MQIRLRESGRNRAYIIHGSWFSWVNVSYVQFSKSAYYLHEKTGYSGLNSNGMVHSGGKFWGNTFRGITFFPIGTEFPEISVPFVHKLGARLLTATFLLLS